MNLLTNLILEDMKPALGVTEPAAIALAAAHARRYLEGTPQSLVVYLNSGMYKNAFTCGVPNSTETGILISAALGLVAGQAEKGLEVLSDITEADHAAALRLVEQGIVQSRLESISSDISIRAVLTTEQGCCEAGIFHSHTNLQYIKKDGQLLVGTEPDAPGPDAEADGQTGGPHPIHRYALKELLDYVETVDGEELAPLKKAYEVNLELLRFSMESDRTVIAKQLLAANGGVMISDDERATAQLLCNGAIEGRVLGLNRAAMSITGSGSHGIICTMPLYGFAKIHNIPQEKLLRATALSYLITMYIKEYSGRLSAFCGCGIAAGTGMACALAWLKGGDEKTLGHVINNMAAGITGMICDGGNHGCTMKGIVAVDAAWRAVELALRGISVEGIHGVCAERPEDTMRQMGMIADPGMLGTERTILDIMRAKAES